MDENPRLSLIFVIAQIGPALRSSLRLAPMLLTSLHLNQHFLAFWHLILYFPCTVSHFQEPWSFLLENTGHKPRPGHLTGSLLEVTGSRLSEGQSQELNTCILTLAYTYTWISVSSVHVNTKNHEFILIPLITILTQQNSFQNSAHQLTACVCSFCLILSLALWVSSQYTIFQHLSFFSTPFTVNFALPFKVPPEPRQL